MTTTSTDPGRTTNTIPYWSSSFTDPTNGVTYPFKMVGKNPTSGQSVTVPTVIVPLNIVYTNPFTINSDGTEPGRFRRCVTRVPVVALLRDERHGAVRQRVHARAVQHVRLATA